MTIFKSLTLSILCFFPVMRGTEVDFGEVLEGSEKLLSLDAYRAAQQKSMLIIIYMAARNDLSPFAKRHISQLKSIGSSDKVKIFIHVDMENNDHQCVTKNFFVEKNKLVQIGDVTYMDSGNEDSLVNTVKTAYELFPAEEVVLILSNHGTGPVEPSLQRVMNTSDLFRYNDETKTLELDRSIGYLDYISHGETAFNETKGICFDDVSGNYLTIAKLTRALKRITGEVMGKKLRLLACDACTMACADVFIGLHHYADYFVASQEVESGLGYQYDIVMKPIINGSISGDQLANHLVTCFSDFYKSRKNTYFTHSAINLITIDRLEKNIDELSQCLLFGMSNQKEKSVKEAIRLSRHEKHCTHFLEPTYVDLGHFYLNLLKNSSSCKLVEEKDTQEFKRQLTTIIKDGLALIKEVVIAKTSGEKHTQAMGISIYLPPYAIHKSYHSNPFAIKTHWLKFLKAFVSHGK